MLLTAVLSLGSTTFGIFGTRRTGGGGDAVEAGRHPPADGRTPETATQSAAAVVLLLLQPLHAGGSPRRKKQAEVKINCSRSLFENDSNKYKGEYEPDISKGNPPL